MTTCVLPLRSRLVACGLMLALLGACNEDGIPTTAAGQQAANTSVPQIAAVEAQSLGDGIVGLRARATDPERSALTFTWRVSDGQLVSSTGPSVLWRVPKTAGTFSATVDVTNAKGAKVSGTQTFTVDAGQQVSASGQLSVQAQAAAQGAGAAGANGKFVVASPLGQVVPNPPIVGGNPSAPLATAAPGQPFLQPVFTPAPGTATPQPLPPPAQPIATPTATPPPQVLPASPLPTLKPPTPEPGVPIPPPLRWIQYDSSKVPAKDVNLKALHFPKPTRGWFVGTKGTVMLYDQTDAAVEPALVFRNFLVPNTSHVSKVHFTSDTTGFIAADDFVMRTTDAGANWTTITDNLSDVGQLTSLVVVNDQVLVLSDNVGGVYRTESANATAATQVFWTTINTKPVNRPGDQASRLYAGAAVPGDPSMTYFVGDAIYRLDADNADTEQVWKKILNMSAALPGSPDLADGDGYSVALPSSSEIWVGTSTGNLLTTKDTGTTWSRLGKDSYRDREFNGNDPFLSAPGPIRALEVLDSSFAFLGGFGGVYDTVDGGKNWRTLKTAFLDDMTVFVETRDGKQDFGGWGISGGAVFRYRPGLP